MNKDLKILYSVFDLLNGEDISPSPSMSNSTPFYAMLILRYLEISIKYNDKPSYDYLNYMKSKLEEVNHCYYQPSELRPPVRINNCPYIEICDKLLKELKNEWLRPTKTTIRQRVQPLLQ